MKDYLGLIRRYRKYLPSIRDDAIITLKEGNTPLIHTSNLRDKIGFKGELYLKFEGLNPTASFKDRGMTFAVSKAYEKGAKAVICASTGNTSASAAAYAAKANIKSYVLIPEGNIAYGKLSQAMIYGTKIVQIKGNFDDALNLVREVGKNFPVEIVNSVNPYRIQGQKTASFEVCEDLGLMPDYHFIPVGNAGNITAYWMGYQEWKKIKKYKKLPKMMGFQASGAAPIVNGKMVKNPKTIASAIRIGNPASWEGAIRARDESKGVIDKVTDKEIIQAYKLVASLEGIFCEPASAVSIAGLIKLIKKNPRKFKKTDVIVCTLTGHGLKDPNIAVENSPKPVSCKADLDSLVKVLKL